MHESSEREQQWELLKKYPEGLHKVIKSEKTAAEIYNSHGEIVPAVYDQAKIVYDAKSKQFYNLTTYKALLRGAHRQELLDKLVGELIVEEEARAQTREAAKSSMNAAPLEAERKRKRDEGEDGISGVGGESGASKV